MENVWKSEREYCLNCKHKPCSTDGCPLGNNIPAFIHEEDPVKAFEVLTETTVLPAICGRVCPHSKQCQGKCVRGITGEPVKIGKVEACIGDISLNEGLQISKLEEAKVNANKKTIKVAVIGSGPCGLTCAAFLARYGVDVTIYEKYNKLGGLLIHGIPDFRLSREVVEKSIEKILELGIKVKTNKALGRDIFIHDLVKEYDAVFISVGANLSNETLSGEKVIKGNEFLEKLNLIQEELGLTTEKLKNYSVRKAENIQLKNREEQNEAMYKQDENMLKLLTEICGTNADSLSAKEHSTKKIAVSGGGNVAMDCARTFKRLGTDVTIVYRRDMEQMPAEDYEIEMAQKEGIKFLVKTNITDFDQENNKLNCVKTELIKIEGDNRLSPRNIEGSEFTIDIDYVVVATGSHSDDELLGKENLELDKHGYIKINEKYQTSIKNVYAGGDVAGENQTVAWAAKSGREAAKAIITEMS